MGKPEKKLQDQCIKYLKDNGIYYINKFGDGRSAKGAPDLIICLNGNFVACELKVGSNDLQEDQKIHKLRIERSGGFHYTPRTLEEFIRVLEALENE